MALSRDNPELYERLIEEVGAEGFEEHEHERLIQEEEARRRGDELASSPRGGMVAALHRSLRKKLRREGLTDWQGWLTYGLWLSLFIGVLIWAFLSPPPK